MSLFLNQLADLFVRNSYSYSSSSNNQGVEFALLGGLMIFYILIFVVAMAICVFAMVCYCKIAHKAGEPWWSMLIPFYMNYTLCKITFGNGWLFLAFFLSFVPFIGQICVLVLVFYQLYKLADVFGHGIGFALGLMFLPVIFLPILAFGSSRYYPERTDFFGRQF